MGQMVRMDADVITRVNVELWELVMLCSMLCSNILVSVFFSLFSIQTIDMMVFG